MQLAGLRILLVEDEYLIARNLARALEAEGADVVGPLPSVQLAVERVDGNGIDAAILDINLRGEMVFPVAERLEAHGIPYMFLSGYEDIAVPLPYRSHTRCTKPVDVPALLRALGGEITAVNKSKKHSETGNRD